MNSGAEHENSENLKNRSKLNFGQIVLGKITAIDIENGLCTVQTYDPAEEVVNCIWLTQSFTAPILGYRIKSLPSIDTNVVLLVGTPSYIISIFDTPDFDESFGLVKTKDGTFLREKYFGDNMYPGYEGSASLLEGEFEIENAFNVGMSFLTNIISLNAGERAKIEAHVLQDMIRIIAEEYRNITPIGEIMSYDDGRPNMEINLGSYVHELLNKRSISTQKAPLSGHSINFPTLDKEDDQDGINTSFGHRFKTYLGYVGNFLSMFVSDPVTTLNGIASGKAHIHIGNSGDILLRTVSEIALERVVRITVPAKRDKKLSKLPDYGNDEFLKKWNYGAGSENTVHQCAYSLRSYARYLSNYASMMRFHQASKGKDGDGSDPYYIPTESEVPMPDMNNKEQDLIQANEPAAFIEGYSTIRIFRDGSILSMDSTGGSVYHGRGVVEISAVKDIRIDAARDISMIAGRHMFLKAKQNIEISSTEGGLVFKSRKLLNMLCELGKIWIKSDADSKNPDDKPEAYGIVIDSSRNNVLINSRDNTILKQEEEDLLIKCEKGSAIINSESNVAIKSQQGNIFMDATSDIVIKSVNTFFQCTKFNIANLLIVQPSQLLLRVKTFLTNKLYVRGDIFSKPFETRQKAIVPCCEQQGTTTGIIPGNYNHVKKITGQTFPTVNSDTTAELNQTISLLNQKINSETIAFKASNWKFQKSFLDLPSDGSKDALFLPHAQDFIETNKSDFTDYITWTFGEEDKLKAAPRTEVGSLPYPFEEDQKENYSDFAVGETLSIPSSTGPKWEQAEVKNRSISRKVKK